MTVTIRPMTEEEQIRYGLAPKGDEEEMREPIPTTLTETLRAERAQGDSLRGITERHGVSTSTVHKATKDVIPPLNGRATQLVAEAYTSMLEQSPAIDGPTLEPAIHDEDCDDGEPMSTIPADLVTRRVTWRIAIDSDTIRDAMETAVRAWYGAHITVALTEDNRMAILSPLLPVRWKAHVRVTQLTPEEDA